jgi:transcriptional regulator with XRE-family HTH domain
MLAVSDVFRARMKTVRCSRGWTQAQLTKRLADAGAMIGSKGAVAKIENGTRKVLLDDAIQIAAALDIALVRLLIPLDRNAEVDLSPTQQVTSKDLRQWIAGSQPLRGGDIRTFLADMPREEFLIHMDSGVAAFTREIEELAEWISNDATLSADDLYDELDRLFRRLAVRDDDRYALLPERLEARRKAKESRSSTTTKASRKKPR